MKHCLLFALTAVCACAPNIHVAQEPMNVMFYNVENLFDTIDNPLTDDDEFTPQGDKRWNNDRYWKKLDNISRVIVAADPADAPEFIGLAEVENESVLSDLTRRSPLRSLGYDYILIEGPDARGINVAFLYKRSFMRVVLKESLRVDLSEFKSATRDVLHVAGRVATGDTIDFYVCHWPSRINGADRTEERRVAAARVVRASVQKVVEKRRKPYIIIMGDFNEGPSERAVQQGLDAVSAGGVVFSGNKSVPDGTLVALMGPLADGSYRYDGRWEKYDQFVVSASLLNGLGCTGVENVRYFSPSFLMEPDTKYGGEKPARTYDGYTYNAGFSDHLPILLDIVSPE